MYIFFKSWIRRLPPSKKKFFYDTLFPKFKHLLVKTTVNKQTKPPKTLATDIRRRKKNRLANLNNIILHGLELHVTHVTTTESPNTGDRTST